MLAIDLVKDYLVDIQGIQTDLPFSMDNCGYLFILKKAKDEHSLNIIGDNITSQEVEEVFNHVMYADLATARHTPTFKPEMSEEYFYVDEYFKVKKAKYQGNFYEHFLRVGGNCFRTAKEASAYIVNLRKELNGEKDYNKASAGV